MNGPDGGTRQCKEKKGQPGLEHPGENEEAGNRADRTGTSGGPNLWTATSGEEAGSPGLERPGGLHKEEETAAARTSRRAVKDIVNKSKKWGQVGWRGEGDRGKCGPCTEASRGPKRQEDQRKEPGLEHPGKIEQASNSAHRTGASRGQWAETLEYIIRGLSE